MLISLNWIRDFVDLPDDLDPRDLAERFTRTTAEVDGVHAIRVGANGLISARVVRVEELPGTRSLLLATLDLGAGKTVETVTAAPVIHADSNVLYAPVGAQVTALGTVTQAEVAGNPSAGMILPGDAVGIDMAAQEAVFLDSSHEPGETLAPELFDDWVIEVDNKSLTHRPDLWGHYGIAREIAAIYGCSLKPYPGVPLEELTVESLPEVEITIADSDACPRYSGIVLAGVPTQPAPLWMQLRLGHVGLRPISGLVDLTNYIMADLGQPMHAFDAGKVDRIEVDWAKRGERFRTLDGVDRELTSSDLMIQCRGKSVALAGVMGGLETEVTEATETLLLESANFDQTTIRKTAGRLALRSEASARFEKSLDPAHTVLSIRRFIGIAKVMYPKMKLMSRLSDGYPKPRAPQVVRVNPRQVDRMIGREVPLDEVTRILLPLEFGVTEKGDYLEVGVPSFRATGDVGIEADVIEELARFIGYNNIVPTMPSVSIRRFEPNALLEVENRTLEHFTTAHAFHEIQGYLWYNATWLDQLGIDPGPCVELKNPAAEGLERLRRHLIPSVLASVEKNRFHFPSLSLIEVGSVFERGEKEDHEYRHVAIVLAKRGKRVEGDLFAQLQGALQGWGWRQFARPVTFARVVPEAECPWEHATHTAAVLLSGEDIGRISVVDLSLRRKMDEHLGAWAIAWAEVRLSGLEPHGRGIESLDPIPDYPLVELDFSILVTKTTRYEQVIEQLGAFDHPLLRLIRYVGSYEGDSVGADRRSLTFRTVVGDDTRTLVEEDTQAFRRDFEKHLAACGHEIRR